MSSVDLMAGPVEIRVMGSFGVVVDGIPTATRDWARRSAATLVKILAITPGRRLHREHAMDLLWPDEPIAGAAPRLHKAAHFARRAAGRPDAVVLRDDLVWLFPDTEVIIDASRFEQLARAAVATHDLDAAREALDWYGGDLLPGDRYEDWSTDRREQLHLRRLDVLRVAGEWRDLTELDPTDEEAHVELMRRHLAAGDAAAAIRQYDHLESALARHHGATPGVAARHARRDADHLHAWPGAAPSPRHIGALLAELADLMNRQSAVVDQLARIGVRSATPSRADQWRESADPITVQRPGLPRRRTLHSSPRLAGTARHDREGAFCNVGMTP